MSKRLPVCDDFAAVARVCDWRGGGGMLRLIWLRQHMAVAVTKDMLMAIRPFGFLRRKDPSVCRYCKWHMVLEEDNRWSCQNPKCRSMSLNVMAIIDATDQAAQFDNLLDRGWICHKPQPS